MTADLNERWLQRRSPFDGWTVSPASDELVPLPILLKTLRGLVGRLEGECVDRALYAAADWHEHDGHVSEGRRIGWDGIHRWLASEDALYAAGHEDAEVRLTVFPDGGSFYLRLLIPRDH